MFPNNKKVVFCSLGSPFGERILWVAAGSDSDLQRRQASSKRGERPELAGPERVGVWGQGTRPALSLLLLRAKESSSWWFCLPARGVEVRGNSPCKLEWVTFQHVGAADTDTASTFTVR